MNEALIKPTTRLPDEQPIRRPDMLDGRRLLSINEVAERCGVSGRTVYRWLNHDGLPTHRLPTTGLRPILRIAEADLDVWLQGHRQDPEIAEAAQRTLRLDGMRFMSTPARFPKTELDSRRRFRPRVAPKEGL